jgi:hypothetical protein
MESAGESGSAPTDVPPTPRTPRRLPTRVTTVLRPAHAAMPLPMPRDVSALDAVQTDLP